MGFHRGRIRIDPDGDYSMHIDFIPDGSECLGVVQVGTNPAGALIFVHSTGEYWLMNRSETVKLLERKVTQSLEFTRSHGGETPPGGWNLG
jgi:hypothetical protein